MKTDAANHCHKPISIIMKYSKTGTLLALLTVCIMHVSAQAITPPLNNPNYSKAKIFTDLPDKMPLRIADLESLLELPVGARINAAVAKNFSIVGTVVSKSNAADTSVRSVVIKATNRQGAIFTFTRTRAADGAVSYLGRMLNKDNGDALEIAKEGSQYVIRKKGLYELMNE